MDKLVAKAQPAIDVGEQLFQKWLDIHYQIFHAFFGTQLGKQVLNVIKTPRQYVYRGALPLQHGQEKD